MPNKPTTIADAYTTLSAGYAAMAADAVREAEATEWIEALVPDMADEPKPDR
jgi:hypothetical protein